MGKGNIMDIINIQPQDIVITAKITETELLTLLEVLRQSEFTEPQDETMFFFKKEFMEKIENLCMIVRAQYGT